MRYRRDIAYNDLPLLPPQNIELETKAVLKKLIPASKALGELKGWSLHQANPYLLLQTLILQEAKASSEIENVVTTNDELYQAYSTEEISHVSPSTKEVLYYREALWTGYMAIRERPLGISVFRQLFRCIKQVDRDVRAVPGTILRNDFGETIYTPPDNRDTILRLLSNLESYINDPRDTLDPLVRLALIHYQFECIHPFSDGNGRTGRILNVLYLVQEGLIDYPILYLSRYIIQNKSEYYRRLQGVTERQEWEPWILYILDAVEKTAVHTLHLLKAIHDARQEMENELRTRFPKMPVKEINDILFEQPYCKIKFLVDRGLAKPQTASRYLSTLAEAGILECRKGGREKYYINKVLFDLLTNAKDYPNSRYLSNQQASLA